MASFVPEGQIPDFASRINDELLEDGHFAMRDLECFAMGLPALIGLYELDHAFRHVVCALLLEQELVERELALVVAVGVLRVPFDLVARLGRPVL